MDDRITLNGESFIVEYELLDDTPELPAEIAIDTITHEATGHDFTDFLIQCGLESRICYLIFERL